MDSNQNNVDTFAHAREEMWKNAADKSLSKEDLIRSLLSITGTVMSANRASYFESDQQTADLTCTVQWCMADFVTYAGATFPNSGFVKLLQGMSDQPVQTTMTAISQNPDCSDLAAHFQKHSINSLLLVPLLPSQSCFFSFADCLSDRTWSEEEIALAMLMKNIVSMRIDQLKTEAEKVILENQLRHAQTLEAIGQLAGGVAHDFNNILGAISGYAEMIKQKFAPGNPKLDKYASAILSGAHKAAELTGKLLAFARRGRYQKLALDIHELISNTIQLLEHSTGPSVKISLQLNAPYHGIIGDPTQMQNILVSITNNALDAMPLGGSIVFTTSNGDIPELLAKSRPETTVGPYVIIAVSDTGTGMDERTKEKLFEPFFTTKDIGKGVGLGLASVYGAITSHEGFISVDSKPGRGTTITLYLPVDKTLL